jgi:hypothetical protein
MKSWSVSCGQELTINNRDRPVESPGAVVSYRLGFWSDVLKPFRAVPRKEFGFKVVLRVVEDATAEVPPRAPRS